MRSNFRYCIFGSALDTGNLGVSALGYSVISNMASYYPTSECYLFDHGRGMRKGCLEFDNGKISFSQLGAVNSLRYYRGENLWLMWIVSKLGLNNNLGVETINKSNIVFDISGGDSFTDLYGMKRFYQVVLPKLITLQQRVPLVLLPQTYGPFRTEKCRSIASDLVKRASIAWARDLRSFEVLKEMLGSSFDPNRHRCSVDIAFSLPIQRPSHLSSEISKCLDSSGLVVGFNVSGLIYNDPHKAKAHYGFVADYKRAMRLLLEQFLERTDAKILLVPHVVAPEGHYESDVEACQKLQSELSSQAEGRLLLSPNFENPCEIKWLISQLDWFCGMRMHSTIAGLSSGVSTAAISYSPKTMGVFESCGQGEAVADPRIMETDEVVDHLWNSWENRDRFRSILAERLPLVSELSVLPFREISNLM